MENNVTPNEGQGTPVNERNSSFGSNVRGFNQPTGNTKGYKPSGEFSFDKSHGPEAQSVDDEGMTTSKWGGHVNVGTPVNNQEGLQPSSGFSFDKDFGTKFNGTEGENGLSAGMDTDKGTIINK